MTLQKYILLVDLASFIIKLQYLFSSYTITPPLIALVRHIFPHYHAASYRSGATHIPTLSRHTFSTFCHSRGKDKIVKFRVFGEQDIIL